jgi:flagellar motor protein MotB
MRIWKHIESSSKVDDDNPYWISFSDIMSGLLVIFVLASLALILELTVTRFEVSEAIREIAKAEQIRRDILLEIEEELRKKNIEVEISDNHTVLRIPEDILSFANNEYKIPESDDIKKTVLEIGHTLYSAITKESRWTHLDTIFIEGHTDRRPTKRRMGNWGLSTFRAISVWNYWNKMLPENEHLESLVNHNGLPLFSVSGYAETRPIQIKQETENDFKKNRRIDIRFTVRKPAIEEFRNIKRLLED